jgi:hypothetical protein
VEHIIWHNIAINILFCGLVRKALKQAIAIAIDSPTQINIYYRIDNLTGDYDSFLVQLIK